MKQLLITLTKKERKRFVFMLCEIKIYTKSHERLSLFLSVVELRYKKINEYKLEHATALLRTKDRKIERDQRRPKNERAKSEKPRYPTHEWKFWLVWIA